MRRPRPYRFRLPAGKVRRERPITEANGGPNEDAARPADEDHAAVTRRAFDRHAMGDKGAADIVDVVHGVCEISEIATAGVRFGIPNCR